MWFVQTCLGFIDFHLIPSICLNILKSVRAHLHLHFHLPASTAAPAPLPSALAFGFATRTISSCPIPIPSQVARCRQPPSTRAALMSGSCEVINIISKTTHPHQASPSPFHPHRIFLVYDVVDFCFFSCSITKMMMTALVVVVVVVEMWSCSWWTRWARVRFDKTPAIRLHFIWLSSAFSGLGHVKGKQSHFKGGTKTFI